MTELAMELPNESSDSSRFAPMLAGVAALLCVLTGGWWLSRYGDLHQVLNLQVAGQLQHVTANQVALALGDSIDNGFAGLDLEVAKREVESLPWVARARAERYWPAGIRVQVWERQPYARWGTRQLLDTEAHAYSPPPADLAVQLPALQGPPGRERDVMDAYQRFSARLANTPFALSGLALDARGEWSALAQNGIGIRLGRSAPDQKFELLLTTVNQALSDRMDQVAYVDLRYTNGFAVGWKNQPVPAAGETHG